MSESTREELSRDWFVFAVFALVVGFALAVNLGSDPSPRPKPSAVSAKAP